MKYGVVALALFTLVGCASIQGAPVDEIAKLPIVRLGEQAPQGMEYVVFYPAGSSFPVTLTTGGSLFSERQQVRSEVSFAKDLYIYKYRASHDGKIWKNSHELLEVTFGGGFDISGLQANITLETKK
jgi:Mlc titration factor MtfA (ptsG expression regulator)